MKKIYLLTAFVLALFGFINNCEAAVTNYSILTSRNISTLGPSVAANCNSRLNSCNFYVGWDGNTAYAASAVTLTIDQAITCRNCTFFISGNSSNTIAITARITFRGATAFNVVPTANNQTATISLSATPRFRNGTIPNFDVASTSAFTHTILYLDAAGRAIPANITNGGTSIVSLFSNITLNGATITGGTVIAANNTVLTLGGSVNMNNAALVIGNNTTGTATLLLEGRSIYLHDGTSSIRLNTANNAIYDASATSSNAGNIYYSTTTNNSAAGLHNLYTGAPGAGQFANTNETNAPLVLPYVRTGSSGNFAYYVQGPSITTINTASPNNSNTLFTTDGSTPLPLTLVNFEAGLQSNGSVALSWTTEQEINSAYFVILRSTDGTTWQAIATVTAHGNSSVAINYAYTDPTAVSGVAYYRLRAVDLDGVYKFSDIRVLTNSTAKGIRVFPNPARDYVNVYLDKPATSPFVVKLLSLNGQVLQQGKFNIGEYSTSMPVFRYPQGQYILQISGADGTIHTTKILVTRQ